MAIDYLTKWVEAHPLQFADSIKVVAFLYKDIISCHEIPQTLISDNSTHFINSFVKFFYKRFKIQYRYTSLYNPQTNELIEYINQTIINFLKYFNSNIKFL